jgi:hypothetical protein
MVSIEVRSMTKNTMLRRAISHFQKKNYVSVGFQRASRPLISENQITWVIDCPKL